MSTSTRKAEFCAIAHGFDAQDDVNHGIHWLLLIPLCIFLCMVLVWW